jgi:hypothetical protein
MGYLTDLPSKVQETARVILRLLGERGMDSSEISNNALLAAAIATAIVHRAEEEREL